MAIKSFPAQKGPDPAGPRILHGYLITSPYGPRSITYGSRFHQGIDLGSGKGGWTVNGNLILAVDDGVVAVHNAGSNGGNWVELKADDGWTYGMFHLSSFNVKTGQRVKVGEILGRLGNSGTIVPHLHFGARPPNWHYPSNQYGTIAWVDPEPLLRDFLNDGGEKPLQTKPKPRPKPQPKPQLGDDEMIQILSSPAHDNWYLYDGFRARPLNPGEPNRLRDMGVIKTTSNGGIVDVDREGNIVPKLVDPKILDTIIGG